MRFSVRSKVGILLSAITILTVVSTFMVTFASRGTASHAASTPPTSASYQAVSLKSNQLVASPTLPNGSTKSSHLSTSPQVLGIPSENKLHGAQTHAAVQRAPVTAGAAIRNTATEGRLLHNFNGISNLDSALANGSVAAEVTPPDQGLCEGRDPSLPGNPTVVFEDVNIAVAEYTPSGKLLRPITSVAGFFGDPNAFSDPRCFYDAQNKTFFFTIISCFTCTTDTVNDVAVLNAHGFALYQFDTTLGGTCFGDQPHVGYDRNNLYMATDQFCGPGQNTYSGALLIAASKSQLINEAASINAVSFGPVSLGNVPILTLQPAISPGIGTEYLLNSFPFDQFGNNNSIANTLGLWRVNGGQNVTTGNFGAVSLTGKIITSETYAFPMPAASTGTGVTTLVSAGGLNNIPVLSEQFLNPDDSRMQQVQAVNNGGHVDLYASLPSAVTIPGDPSARDGVAWFKIDAGSRSIEAQGYVAVAGSYLLYPAIYHTNDGTTSLVFTITSPTLNPSAAYAVMKSGATRFSSVKISALGADAHLSFAFPLFAQSRWGDYSAAALDQSGNNIWLATEYIPPLANQAPFDNWGTSIFEVAGNS
jgi:hypothetical protein